MRLRLCRASARLAFAVAEGAQRDVRRRADVRDLRWPEFRIARLDGEQFERGVDGRLGDSQDGRDLVQRRLVRRRRVMRGRPGSPGRFRKGDLAVPEIDGSVAAAGEREQSRAAARGNPAQPPGLLVRITIRPPPPAAALGRLMSSWSFREARTVPVEASTRQASMKASMSDTGSSSASASSRITDAFFLTADRPRVLSHRKTRIS
jgi:hypothetical protein